MFSFVPGLLYQHNRILQLLFPTFGLLPVLLPYDSLGGGKPRDWYAERGTAHIFKPDAVTEVD